MGQITIIMEGAEKTGKTEIARELSKRLNIPYYKDRWQKQKEPLTLKIWDFLTQTNCSAIIDRDFPSYYVYYKYYGLEISPDFYVADKMASDLGAKIVVCSKTKYLNYNDEVPIEANKKLNELYTEFSLKTKCRVTFIDTTNEDLEKEIDLLMRLW